MRPQIYKKKLRKRRRNQWTEGGDEEPSDHQHANLFSLDVRANNKVVVVVVVSVGHSNFLLNTSTEQSSRTSTDRASDRAGLGFDSNAPFGPLHIWCPSNFYFSKKKYEKKMFKVKPSSIKNKTVQCNMKKTWNFGRLNCDPYVLFSLEMFLRMCTRREQLKSWWTWNDSWSKNFSRRMRIYKPQILRCVKCPG